MSVIVRPPAAALEVLSVKIGLRLAEALDRLLVAPASIALKWPNDLLIAGRKVAGILCEARWQGDRLGWVVASVGLNVRNPVPSGLEDRATRLADHGFAAGPESLADPLRTAILTAAAGAGGLDAAELADFTARDWLRGRALADPAQAVALGITPSGKLRLRRPDGSVGETLGPIRVAGEE